MTQKVDSAISEEDKARAFVSLLVIKDRGSLGEGGGSWPGCGAVVEGHAIFASVGYRDEPDLEIWPPGKITRFWQRYPQLLEKAVEALNECEYRSDDDYGWEIGLFDEDADGNALWDTLEQWLYLTRN